ncbi:outer membrane lipoprotein-sorting protein [Granulicella sp. WH15]|uniref:LolA family protein n=1 Tax=Granulicella sp. WH15 TaxID=2602070 RepID=UPI00136743C5|nr:outer membrane lipoprotein-sorting protein [Granulicella sp. WH15]QHN02861.1 outer membrane lipoprotein-sorting protein [Granulicella sp. WH15]
MKTSSWWAMGLVLSASVAQAQGNLQASMAKLDAASAQFKSVQADFHKVFHHGPSLPIPDETQDGKIYVMRVAGKPQFGILTLGADSRTVQYMNGSLKAYNPKIKCYDPVNGGSKIEAGLTLGFGGSGKEMQAAWNVTDLGPETLDGAKVEKLDLTPKDQSVRSNIEHVTLWILLDRGYALKQVLYAPGGDVQTAVYTNIRYNENKVDTKPFEFNSKPCGK